MALSREEVNRRLADAAAAQRGQVHQLGVDTRLSDEQLDELSTVDARGRRDRARELVALEGRAWHRTMDAQLERLNDSEPQPSPPSRPLREIAVPLDDLDVPMTGP